MIRNTILFLTVLGVASTANAQDQVPVGDALTRARAADGSYISWREHLIDDPTDLNFAVVSWNTVLTFLLLYISGRLL